MEHATHQPLYDIKTLVECTNDNQSNLGVRGQVTMVSGVRLQWCQGSGYNGIRGQVTMRVRIIWVVDSMIQLEY